MSTVPRFWVFWFMDFVKSIRIGDVVLIALAISSQILRVVPVGEKYISPTVGFWLFILVASVLGVDFDFFGLEVKS
jgi:hypothetical protein